VSAAGLFVLRMTLAFVLVSHGGHVLFGLASGGGLGPGGLATAAARYDAGGLQPGMLVAVIVGVVQFVSGMLIGLGLLARWASIATMALLLILLWKEQAQWGFYLNWALDPTRGHGMEFSIVITGALACLFLTGPGEWSFDGRRQGRAASRAAGRARLHRHD
jgi:putative oxidoreductase